MSRHSQTSQIIILFLLIVLLGINVHKLFYSNQQPEAYCDNDAQCRAGKEKCINKNCIPIG
jgi:hypothetical protein